jgi:hypothetical protein
MKRSLIAISVIFILTGCSTRVISHKQIELQSNARNAQEYKISYEFANPDDSKEISVTANQNSEEINSVIISGQPTTFDMTIKTDQAKFRFMKDHWIKGWIVLKPSASHIDIVRIPFSVKINSWLNTHYWLMLCFLGLLLILAIINFVFFYIFKVPATGTVELLYPARESYLIYPRSRWFHLHRNRCIIGSGKKDDVFIKGKQGLRPGQIIMTYYKQSSGKCIAAEVRTYDFYFKNSSEIIQLPSRDLRFGYTMPDYILSEEEDSTVLFNRQYSYGNKSTIDTSSDKVYVNKDIVLKISLN